MTQTHTNTSMREAVGIEGERCNRRAAKWNQMEQTVTAGIMLVSLTHLNTLLYFSGVCIFARLRHATPRHILLLVIKIAFAPPGCVYTWAAPEELL